MIVPAYNPFRPRMRVTHISIIHKPLDVRIFEKECRALAGAGYEVHLIVGAPPATEVDGVLLHSVANDSTRPLARRQWARLLRAARWAFRLRPSIYHLHDPHLIPLGLLLKLSGARVVYDVHEDYPAHARSKLVAHPLLGLLKAFMWIVLESLAQRGLDGFVCASPALAEKFPATSTVVVRNFPRHREFALPEVEPGSRPYRKRRNTLVYTGNIREIRGFWEMVRALELLPADLDCRLRMIGWFTPPELARSARRLEAWSRMEFIPWQRHRVLVRELLSAKIGLILLHPLPNHGDPIRSNKLFEFMAAGIPVIAPELPRWREIVCGIGCGLVVDPRDPAAIAAAIEDLLRRPEEAEAMGRRGQAAVRTEFNWDAEAPRLLSLYRRFEDGQARFRTAPPPESLTSLAAAERRTALLAERRTPSA
ncbi:MAG: glycosyltransferase family 4 protein [Solirubrobacterales bacterium]